MFKRLLKFPISHFLGTGKVRSKALKLLKSVNAVSNDTAAEPGDYCKIKGLLNSTD